jgi:hypothetical protein
MVGVLANIIKLSSWWDTSQGELPVLCPDQYLYALNLIALVSHIEGNLRILCDYRQYLSFISALYRLKR